MLVPVPLGPPEELGLEEDAEPEMTPFCIVSGPSMLAVFAIFTTSGAGDSLPETDVEVKFRLLPLAIDVDNAAGVKLEPPLTVPEEGCGIPKDPCWVGVEGAEVDDNPFPREGE